MEKESTTHVRWNSSVGSDVKEIVVPQRDIELQSSLLLWYITEEKGCNVDFPD